MRFLVLVFLLIATGAHAEFATEVVDLDVRPGAINRLLLVKPEAPVATVLLFAGGDGRLGLGPAGNIAFLGGNFLIRTRDSWASQGFLTVIVDAPSDRQGPDGLGPYRLESGHARDVAAIIRYARSRTKLPVWLVGTSRGTISAAYAAGKIADDPPDGLVLTSSIVAAYKAKGSPIGDDVFDADLKSIRMPVLVVHHREDTCQVTPFSAVQPLVDKLVNATPAELIGYTGGLPPRSAPCEARAAHGYFGIEERVVGDIGAWIKAHRR